MLADSSCIFWKLCKRRRLGAKFLSKLVLTGFRCLGHGFVACCVVKCPKMSHLLLLLPMNKQNKIFYLIEKMMAKHRFT
jgi:hypothetical protein